MALIKHTLHKIDLGRDHDGRHISTRRLFIWEASALQKAHTFTAFVVAKDHNCFRGRSCGAICTTLCCLTMRGLVGFFGVSGGTDARGSKGGTKTCFLWTIPIELSWWEEAH